MPEVSEVYVDDRRVEVKNLMHGARVYVYDEGGQEVASGATASPSAGFWLYRRPIEGEDFHAVQAFNEVDEVVGLELGADDYLAKPVKPRLLLARVHMLLRRLRRAEDRRPVMRVVVGALAVDGSARTVHVGGEEVRLTTAEFDLLWLLARRAGEVVSRDDLYRELRGIEYDGMDRSIDLRVTRIRKKLGDDAQEPRLLKSIRGVGYLLARDTRA